MVSQEFKEAIRHVLCAELSRAVGKRNESNGTSRMVNPVVIFFGIYGN